MEDNNIFEKESQWEQSSEICEIQKTIRRRNWKIISVSVVLAAAVLLGSVYGVIPLVEKLYWNPDESAYKERTDLEATLHAYTELFAPGYNTALVTYHRTGFASYELQIPLVSTARNEMFSARGSLDRNVLHVDDFLESPEGKNYVIQGRQLPIVPPAPSETEALRERLRALPEYIRLEAKVEFAEDLSMEELMDFREKLCWDITWVYVRTKELSTEWTPLCGMDPFTSRIVYSGVDYDYPCFNMPAKETPEKLEQHFISLLQYSADQLEKGRGIALYDDEALYNEILDYVKGNGVKTYGVVVTASPQELLELLDSDLIRDVRPMDGWVDIG